MRKREKRERKKREENKIKKKSVRGLCPFFFFSLKRTWSDWSIRSWALTQLRPTRSSQCVVVWRAVETWTLEVEPTTKPRFTWYLDNRLVRSQIQTSCEIGIHLQYMSINDSSSIVVKEEHAQNGYKHQTNSRRYNNGCLSA